MAARAKGGPRLKVTANSIKFDHPDAAIGTLAIMRAIGTADLNFFEGLTPTAGGKTEAASLLRLATDSTAQQHPLLSKVESGHGL